MVEGNHYFPPESVAKQYLRPSEARTVCSWKGVASYYDIVVDDDVNKQAAWYYPDPQPEAAHTKNHVAFWKDVKVIA